MNLNIYSVVGFLFLAAARQYDENNCVGFSVLDERSGAVCKLVSPVSSGQCRPDSNDGAFGVMQPQKEFMTFKYVLPFPCL